MVLDLILKKTDDGFNAYIPKLNGCDSWAHNEDDALRAVIEMAMFYLKIDDRRRMKIDKARTEENKTIYKLIFNK
ncbi:MAG TPA: hypothetical protein VFF33_08445 [Ignavibacteriaceae bacterium]|nr:hypothetical protein [Ignavibacteriaceae bacterium]